MPVNVRNVVPYFSSIKLVLFPGVTQVAVQDQQGRQGTQLVDEPPQIRTTITGWINHQVVRQDVFVFDAEPVDTPSMTDVLESARELGIDVAETWSSAFDQVAELFPATKDQEASAANLGPKVYLRADAFEANLHPTQKKSVTMKVGVYSKELKDSEGIVVGYDGLQTYINLTFEDGETKREREANLASLNRAKSELQQNLERTNLLLEARIADDPVPKLPNGDTFSDFVLRKTIDELLEMVKQLESELGYRTKQIAELTQVLNGDLSLLLGSKTPLQKSVMLSVGALCTAILITLKKTHPDYAEIDVEKIMAQFAVPDIS